MSAMRREALAAIEALRTEGRRITTARRVVIDLLAGSDEHLSAETIAARVHDAQPEIHLSTVYRTLESLQDMGLVDHVHQPHGPSFFHLRSEGPLGPRHLRSEGPLGPRHLAAGHSHLVCEECGRIVDIPQAEFDALVAQLRARYGFAVHVGHVALTGRCMEHGGVA